MIAKHSIRIRIAPASGRHTVFRGGRALQPVGRWALGHHRWAVWEKFKTQRLARDCLPFVWQVQHSVHLECRFRGRRSTRGVSRWQVLLVLFHAVEPATRFMLLQFPQECACPNSPAQRGGLLLAGIILVLLHAVARATCFMWLGVRSKAAQIWCVYSQLKCLLQCCFFADCKHV